MGRKSLRWGAPPARSSSVAANIGHASAVIVIAAVGGACIDDSREGRDVVEDDSVEQQCSGDEDCARFTNACNRSICSNERCLSAPTVCDDHNDCTSDRCDVIAGCLFQPRPAGSVCVQGPSGECVGETWHAKDACDADGACVDGGSTDCSASASSTCERGTCSAGVGCGISQRPDGASCVADGISDSCVDDVRHAPDVCVTGVCVDAGRTACPAAFCQLPKCDGRMCGLDDIGVALDLTGGWNLFDLLEPTPGALAATRTEVELLAGGALEVLDRVGPSSVVKPDDGGYCVSRDGRMQLGLRYPDGTQQLFKGRVTAGRDLAVLTPVGFDGTLVMVRNRETSEARLIGGTYRIVGLDNVVVDGTAKVDAILGAVTIAGSCITGGTYSFGSRDDSTSLTIPEPPTCLSFAGANSTAFDVRAQGDVRVWSGVVGTLGQYAVLQRYRVGERVVEPSLVLLVRYGLARQFELTGDYALARLDVDGGFATLATGVIGVDGFGVVTHYSEGDFALDGSDIGSIEVASEVPPGGFLATLTIRGEQRRRVGQLGPTSSARVDWFVDVATGSNFGLHGPPVGRSLQFGIGVVP